MNSYPHPPEVDLHTHTVASGHAYSTINEMAQAAAAAGLRGLGMTDHGPALPGGPHPFHFHALRFVPRELYGVRILRGIEANILGPGELDLAEDKLAQLDLILAGLHEECGVCHRSSAENTAAVLQVVEPRKIHVLTHPGNPAFPVDAEVVARAAAAAGVAIEINNASFSLSRPRSSEPCRAIARWCAHYHTPVAIGSDAHIAQGVGQFDEALAVVASAGVRWEQIVNRTLASTLAFLGLPG